MVGHVTRPTLCLLRLTSTPTERVERGKHKSMSKVLSIKTRRKGSGYFEMKVVKRVIR